MNELTVPHVLRQRTLQMSGWCVVELNAKTPVSRTGVQTTFHGHILVPAIDADENAMQALGMNPWPVSGILCQLVELGFDQAARAELRPLYVGAHDLLERHPELRRMDNKRQQAVLERARDKVLGTLNPDELEAILEHGLINENDPELRGHA